MTITRLEEAREQLKDLRVQHHQLNQQVDALASSTSPINGLEIRRLKKQKLLLKDRIVHLESALIPDLNA
ncbi:Uncharacterised protein [BD1-7 clade bacterium]|uniref:DUF465 domain-containing protein n=1 Tax=BD1-7 clade bacterium TaxID=2029982 RepID=A0A5S9N3L5_9GAMM|nr:Uncharacterised protein [BD1-7 clade bacterium]CAA0084085.1 Uncharacterised protein [BD1-7 clade bacterium]